MTDYEKARSLVLETQKASVCHLTRSLRIRYRDSAMILEKMERKGIVGKIEAPSGCRRVLKGTK